MIINKKKKKKKIVDFAVQAHHRVKTEENEKREKYLDLAREPKKVVEYECNGDAYCNWHTLNSLQSEKGLEELEISGRAEVIETTARILIPGDLIGFAVTQTPVKDHQLTLEWKIQK